MEAHVNIESIWDQPISSFPLIKKVLSITKKKNEAKPLQTPAVIKELCDGVLLDGKKIKSLIFSTDMALIENNDADAVLAVYPFTPSPKIMKSLIDFSEKPVICGVGGGLTQGKVALEMAIAAEDLGAKAIIVNQPFKNKHIELIKKRISIPIISSVSVSGISFSDRVNAGVDIFHVTAGQKTPELIDYISYAAPGYPVMATGGKTLESITSSIHSGADAIVVTPPSSSELFRSIMDQYRRGISKLKKQF